MASPFSSGRRLSVQLSQRVGLVPLTLRARVRRGACTAADRTLLVRIYWEDFSEPLFITERQLDGCDSPLTWSFERDVREPGVYTVVADILPTGAHASESAEFR